MVGRVVMCAWLVAGCSSSDGERPAADPEPAPAAPATNTTPNQFYARGAPTFIVGTAGDDGADAAVAGQVRFARGLFAAAAVVDDTAPGPWPRRPVVYGGSHENRRLASATLPLSVDAGGIDIGGARFAGGGYRIIAVVPEVAGSHPELLLYAGTGPRGVAEINGVRHGGDPILIADEFGALVTGRWEAGPDGPRAVLADRRARRIEWRAVPASGGAVSVRFPAQLAPRADEAAVVDAVARGVELSAERLGVGEAGSLTVYVYPDRGSVASLTGVATDGYAVPSSRVLHVVASPPDLLAALVAHEATHVLAYYGWGPAGSTLFGEGLAVWVSGQYGGQPLAAHRGKLASVTSVGQLLGTGFAALAEGQSYPAAGLLVDRLIDRVGLAAVRDHLFAATPSTWAAACAGAGISPADVDRLLAAAIGR